MGFNCQLPLNPSETQATRTKPIPQNMSIMLEFRMRTLTPQSSEERQSQDGEVSENNVCCCHKLLDFRRLMPLCRLRGCLPPSMLANEEPSKFDGGTVSTGGSEAMKKS